MYLFWYNWRMSMPEVVLSVRFFALASGREPVREFLQNLDAADRRAVGVDIKTVQLGWPLGMPLVRKMGDHLWEVRSTLAVGIVRVLFTVENQHMILLHAFIKKSQKTPENELQTAVSRLKQLKRE